MGYIFYKNIKKSPRYHMDIIMKIEIVQNPSLFMYLFIPFSLFSFLLSFLHLSYPIFIPFFIPFAYHY